MYLITPSDQEDCAIRGDGYGTNLLATPSGRNDDASVMDPYNLTRRDNMELI